MPSPDVSAYVDLTLFDLNSQDIYLKALEYARIALPEWQPVEGSLENVMLQAMALEVQEMVTAINRLPGGVVQALLGILGVPRRAGTASTGTIRINASRDGVFSIPAGFRLIYTPSVDAQAVTLLTTERVTLTRFRPLASIERASNEAIVTTIEQHGISTDDINGAIPFQIIIDATGDAGTEFNGTHTVTEIVSDTQFKFDSAGTNVAEIDLSATASTAEVAPSMMPYGFVEVTSLLPGTNYISEGTPLTTLTSVRDVGSAVLVTDLDGGYETETDSAYFKRASAALSRMTDALVTANQMAQYVASEYPQVYRVKAIDNCSASRISPGFPDEGSITEGEVLIVGAPIGATETNTLTTGTISDIIDSISERAHAALTINADNALGVTVSVSADVHPVEGVAASVVETACEEALAAYLNPDTWNWDNVVRVNEVMHALRGATYNGTSAVAYVESVELSVTGSNVADVDNPFGAGTFSTASRASDVLTVPATAHGLNVNDYVAFTTGGDWVVGAVLSTPSANSFTVDQTGTNGTGISGSWAPIATYDNLNNLVIFDPAPLVFSGVHFVNTD